MPGAELSNFWRNMDKEMGIGLRTKLETNLDSESPGWPLLCPPVPSPAGNLLKTMIRGGGDWRAPGGLSHKGTRKTALCFQASKGSGPPASFSSLPSSPASPVGVSPTSQADGKGVPAKGSGSSARLSHPVEQTGRGVGALKGDVIVQYSHRGGLKASSGQTLTGRAFKQAEVKGQLLEEAARGLARAPPTWSSSTPRDDLETKWRRRRGVRWRPLGARPLAWTVSSTIWDLVGIMSSSTPRA